MTTPVSLEGKKIGCIGCGNMGSAILNGLSQLSEIHLFGYNRTRSRLAPLEEKGVTAVDSIPAIARACGMTENGAYHPMDILPWEYPLLLRRTLARLCQNTGGTRL